MLDGAAMTALGAGDGTGKPDSCKTRTSARRRRRTAKKPSTKPYSPSDHTGSPQKQDSAVFSGPVTAQPRKLAQRISRERSPRRGSSCKTTAQQSVDYERATLCGLVTRHELNGQSVKLLRFDEESQRWIVKHDESAWPIRVQPMNLENYILRS